VDPAGTTGQTRTSLRLCVPDTEGGLGERRLAGSTEKEFHGSYLPLE
jgi:hypothetical protein